MEVYYSIYVLVLLSLLFELKGHKYKRYVIVFWCIFFTLFGGLRWNMGSDWDQFYYHFQQSSWKNIFSYDRYGNGQELLEPGYVFLNVLVKSLFSKYYVFNTIVCGFLQFTNYKFVYKFSPKRPLLFYGFIVFTSMNFFPVRNGLSMGFVFWAMMAIYERNIIKFLIFSFLASSIHYQCILIFPMYWIGKIKLNNLVYVAIFILVVILRYILENLFRDVIVVSEGEILEKAEYYSNISASGHSASYISWGLFFFFLLNYLYIRNFVKKKYLLWYNTLLNGYMIYVSIFIVFSENMGTLSRLASVVGGTNLILFIYTINFYISRKNEVVKMGAIIFFVLYCCYKMLGVANSLNGYFEKVNVPYRTIYHYHILR